MQQTNQITKLTIAEPEQFVRFFKFYDKCNDNTEITLNFEKDKLSFREMDRANTLLTEITLKDSLFVEFYAEKGKKGISMPDFLSFLKRASEKDLLVMEFNDIKYNVILKSCITRTFTGNILNLEKTEQKLPELKHATKLAIDSKTLYDFLKDFKKEAHRIEVTAIKDKLKLRVFDYEPKQIGITEIEATECIAEKPAKSVYSFELFKNSISNKLTEKIQLSLGNEYPLRIEYANNNFNAMVIVAPITDAEMPKEEHQSQDKETHNKLEIKVIPIREEKEFIKVKLKDLEKTKTDVKEIVKINKKFNEKRKKLNNKLDLDALGFNENFKCPNCKDMISFYYFIDKFATQVGSIKEILEQDYNADPQFAEFVFENSKLDDELDKYINSFIREKLKEMFKKFRRD